MQDEPIEEKPPFFNTWKQMYAFVLGLLAVIIVLLYLFSQVFT